MILEITPTSNTLDMTSALVALNSLLLLVVGWVLNECYSAYKSSKIKNDQTREELILFKQKTEDAFTHLESMYQKDIKGLKECMDEISEKIDTLKNEY